MSAWDEEYAAQHDRLCEIELDGPEYRNPCRCADRRAGASLDPKLLAMRVKRVRQAEAALATVKHTLVSYITEHAPSTCEAVNSFNRCGAPIDGILLVSCGHSAALCSTHASATLRDRDHSSEIMCTKTTPDLHAAPVAVTLEWQGIA